jgi:hypothetical protein
VKFSGRADFYTHLTFLETLHGQQKWALFMGDSPSFFLKNQGFETLTDFWFS